MNREELIEAVRQWGEAKGITGPNGTGTIQGQLDKLDEELQELKDSVNDDDPLAIEDAIGDMQVVMILLCQLISVEYQFPIDMTYSLDEVYRVISKRTGKMVNGQFVKDEPEKQ